MADTQAIAHLKSAQLIRYLSVLGSVDVEGIFDRRYMFVPAGTAGVADYAPAVFLRLADLPSNPLVDASARIAVGGNEYVIVEPQVDETGGVLLILHRETEDSLTDNAGAEIVTSAGHALTDGNGEVIPTAENDLSDIPIPEAP